MESKYRNYGVSEFVADDDFLQHCLFPTESSVIRWQRWLEIHSDRKEVWEEAAALLEAVRLGLSDYTRTYLSEEAENQLLQRITKTNERFTRANELKRIARRRATVFSSAASITLLLLAGWYFMLPDTPPASPYVQLTEHQIDSLSERVNTSRSSEDIRLPDGTRVTLFPGSRLSYHTNFGKAERRVYLSGEAGFDVVLDTDAPFVVYANEIVTKVLGTRFTVSAFESADDITVKVSSGKVAVFRNDALPTNNRKPSVQQELLLLSNQQAVFHKSVALFQKSLVDNPKILPVPASRSMPDFIYDETPVQKVFEDLEAAYGIEIVYNGEVLAECQLTASLTEESFSEKLDIICKSIGATCKIVDARMIVTSKGCQ